MGQADGAVVVTAQELHARLVGLGQDGQGRLDVVVHGRTEAESTALHQGGEAFGEELGRNQEGPKLHHPFDGPLIQPVAMIDHVDPGTQSHVDGLPIGDVAPHLRTALMGRFDPGREFLA